MEGIASIIPSSGFFLIPHLQPFCHRVNGSFLAFRFRLADPVVDVAGPQVGVHGREVGVPTGGPQLLCETETQAPRRFGVGVCIVFEGVVGAVLTRHGAVHLRRGTPEQTAADVLAGGVFHLGNGFLETLKLVGRHHDLAGALHRFAPGQSQFLGGCFRLGRTLVQRFERGLRQRNEIPVGQVFRGLP